MRILHLGDVHLHFSGPRAAECRRILDYVGEHAADALLDAVIIAGDVFDTRSTPAERLYLASWLSALADVAPVEIIHGNHDSPDDVELFGRLDMPRVRVWTRPIVVKQGDALIAFLPWPDLGRLAAALPSSATIDERREAARGALLDILRGMHDDLAAHRGPTLLVAHMPVTGAAMDSGQPVTGGAELALSADDLLTCGAGGVALGHVHLRQQMKSGDDRPVWYSGATFRGSFGEATGGKGGLLWEWAGSRWNVVPWDVPARRMLLINRRWTEPEEGSDDEQGGGLEYDSGEDQDAAQDVRDAEVRLRVAFPADRREAALRIAGNNRDSYLSLGAVSVTLDPRPIIVQRTRCSKITAARTTAEKLAAWAQAVAVEVPSGAAGKLAEIETEVQA